MNFTPELGKNHTIFVVKPQVQPIELGGNTKCFPREIMDCNPRLDVGLFRLQRSTFHPAKLGWIFRFVLLFGSHGMKIAIFHHHLADVLNVTFSKHRFEANTSKHCARVDFLGSWTSNKNSRKGPPTGHFVHEDVSFVNCLLHMARKSTLLGTITYPFPKHLKIVDDFPNFPLGGMCFLLPWRVYPSMFWGSTWSFHVFFSGLTSCLTVGWWFH